MPENEKKKPNSLSWLEQTYRKVSENRNASLAVIALLCFLIYSPTFFFSFTQYDDDFLIVNNMDSLTYVGNVGRIFQMPYFDYYYRPLVTLSLMIDAQLGGVQPVMYHITNVLLHIIASCLVFLVLKRIQSYREVALAGSILFAVLPVISQATAWIPGRNDSLLAVFVFASLYMLLLYSETNQKKYIALHVLFFFAGLLTKESALFVPLFAWFFITNVMKKKQSVSQFPLVASWIIVLIAWWYLRDGALAQIKEQHQILSLTTFVANLRVPFEILGKTFFPFNLSAYATFDNVSLAMGVGICVAFLLLVVFNRQRIDRMMILFGLGWFIVFLVPSLAVTIQDSAHRFDYLEHRSYLPVFGIVIALAEISRIWKNSINNYSVIAFSVIVILFASLTVRHTMNFRNPVVTWTHITQASPKSAQAHFILGTIYEDSSKLNDASTCYAKAAELNPDKVQYHNNLGSVYAKLGMFPQAAEEFFKTIRIDSLNPYPYHNLGSIYYLGRKFNEAEYYWKRAVELQPDITDPYVKLIRLYIMQRQEKEALYYSQLLKAKGMDIVAQVVQALQQAGTKDTVK